MAKDEQQQQRRVATEAEREATLNAKPVRAKALARERRGEGMLVVVGTKPNMVQKLTGMKVAPKRYELDAMGRFVYEICDGKTPVRAIIKRFAAKFDMDERRAELSVTMFLRGLAQKGLVHVLA